jgi:hypothetical protein
VRQQYERRFGDRYNCESPKAAELGQLFLRLTDRYGIARHMPVYQPEQQMQLKMF